MAISIEKEILLDKMTSAFDEFISLLSSFDQQSIDRIPFTGSWTPGQVATHIILATDGVPDNKTAARDRQFDALLPMIRPWWEDLNQKFKSPEPLLPDDKPHTKDELLAELHRVCKKDVVIIFEKDLTEICLDFDLPSIGYLTRYEWLWFIEMHLRRHSFQLKNILTVMNLR